MIKLFLKREEAADPDKQRLAREYRGLIQRLSDIRTNFDFVSEEEQIDALIYEENSVLARLAAFYRSARENDSRLEIYEFKK